MFPSLEEEVPEQPGSKQKKGRSQHHILPSCFDSQSGIDSSGRADKKSISRRKKHTAKSKLRGVIRAGIVAGAGEAVLAVAVDVAAGVGVLEAAAGLLSAEELEPRVRVAHGGRYVLGCRRRGGFGCPAVRVGEGGGRCRVWSGPLEGVCCLETHEEEGGEQCEGGVEDWLLHPRCCFFWSLVFGLFFDAVVDPVTLRYGGW